MAWRGGVSCRVVGCRLRREALLEAEEGVLARLALLQEADLGLLLVHLE